MYRISPRTMPTPNMVSIKNECSMISWLFVVLFSGCPSIVAPLTYLIKIYRSISLKMGDLDLFSMVTLMKENVCHHDISAPTICIAIISIYQWYKLINSRSSWNISDSDLFFKVIEAYVRIFSSARYTSIYILYIFCFHASDIVYVISVPTFGIAFIPIHVHPLMIYINLLIKPWSSTDSSSKMVILIYFFHQTLHHDNSKQKTLKSRSSILRPIWCDGLCIEFAF